MSDTLTIAARRTDWQAALRSVQAAPLTACPAFPEVTQRWIDWWRFKADRPLLVISLTDGADIRWDKGFDLLDQPEAWVRMRRAQVLHRRYFGEALPSARVDIGPVSMAAFMGAPLHFALEEQTSWQEPIIEAWHERPSLQFDPGNRWFRKVMTLLDALVDDARGNYLVCLPDLTGALDALANLRGSERLCFDLLDAREEILSAAEETVAVWEAVFTQMYDAVLSRGAGITQWVSAWANEPLTVPTCDFNALIGPDDFREVCMPSLTDQARRAGLCAFHLDGPDAARHAATLAADPDITALQYTPGAGTPSAAAQLPMLRMIQEHRKPLFIECPAGEVEQVLEELDPAGVALRVGGLDTVEQADALVAWRDRQFGG